MSDFLEQAKTLLSDKLTGTFEQSAKFAIDGEGALMVGPEGVSVADADALVTMSMDRETFEDIMSGEADPTGAYMHGKMKIDGDLGLAMQLGAMMA